MGGYVSMIDGHIDEAPATDREKLIALIRHEVVPYFAERIADHLIANGVTIQRWIPVTEKLPESGKIVLIYQDGGWGAEGSYSTYDKKWRRFGWGSGCIDATHWMPLPQPPKEVE